MEFPPLTPAAWSQLEAYADGHLDSTARTALEARLATDASLRAALAAHRALVTGIRAEGRAALRGRLGRLEAELARAPAPHTAPAPQPAPAVAATGRPQMRVSWSAGWARMAAAAAVVLAAGLGWLVLRGPDAQTLADRYGVPEPGLPVLMGAPAPGPRALVGQAMNAYKTGNPAAALAVWATLPAGAVGADTVLYYQGIFELKLHHNAEAAAAMARLRALPATAFRERADYYYALALWAQNRPAEARAAFERLAATPNHSFRADARQALDHLQQKQQ